MEFSSRVVPLVNYIVLQRVVPPAGIDFAPRVVPFVNYIVAPRVVPPVNYIVSPRVVPLVPPSFIPLYLPHDLFFRNIWMRDEHCGISFDGADSFSTRMDKS